jgi:hypothetical protein
MNCPPLRVVAAGKVVLPVRRRGLPGYLIGLLPDGVVGVSDGLGSAPVRANAYILRHRPWSLPSAVTYRLAKGTQRTVRLP